MKFNHLTTISLLFFSTVFNLPGQTATTNHSSGYPDIYLGSMMPLPLDSLFISNDSPALPDSLTPFFLNQVSRHGARFLSSEAKVSHPRHILEKAKYTGSLTPDGERFISLLDSISDLTAGRWGQLTALGAREQECMAAHTDSLYPSLFSNGKVEAFASFVPRVVSSMYAFCHQISLLHPQIEIDAQSGPRFNPLLRFFNTDSVYTRFVKTSDLICELNDYTDSIIPVKPAERLIGNGYPSDYLRKLTMYMYDVIQGENAMGLRSDPSSWFSLPEWRRCWKAADIGHALKHIATPLSDIPAKSAVTLLEDIIATADSVISGDRDLCAALRFGHAETLMPLLSLMRVQNCYLPENTAIDDIPDFWQDWKVVPLGATFQLIYFRAPSGNVYVTGYLNGQSISLIPDCKSAYIKWETYKKFLISRIKCISRNNLITP